jgi:hypothetical protein
MIEILQENDEQKRRGIVGWWLRLTAPPGAQQYDQANSHRERERLRRSQLTSWTAPFVCFAPLLLLQQAADPGTLAAIVVLMSTALLALVFNRLGKQTLAALLLVLSMDASIEGAILTSIATGGLSSGWLLTFDLFVVPLITVGVLLNRRFLWLFVLLHVGCILGDFYLLPHTQDLTDLIQYWHGPSVAFARPLIIQIGGCLLSFIQIRSTDQAIIRADRAQFIAQLQQSTVKQKEELDKSIREILGILTRAANGDFNANISLPQGSILWQIASALNTLFTRLQRSRQAEVVLYHVEQEVAQLAEALRRELSGQPAQWPKPNGGPLDQLIWQLQTLAAYHGQEASPHPTTPLPWPTERPSRLRW